MLPALVHIQSGVASCMPGHVESLTVVHRSGVGAPWSHRRRHPQPLIYTLSSCLNPPPTPIPHPPPHPASFLAPARLGVCVGEEERQRAALSSPLLSLGPWEPGLRGGGGGPQTGNASLGSCCRRAGCKGWGWGLGRGWAVLRVSRAAKEL